MKKIIVTGVLVTLLFTGCQGPVDEQQNKEAENKDMVVGLEEVIKENLEAEIYNELPTLEQTLGIEIKQLSTEQLMSLEKDYEEIKAFEVKDDGSNEEIYYELIDNFEWKMKAFGLKIPYYSYIEYADDHKDKISLDNYKRLEKLDEAYGEMTLDAEISDEDAYDKVVEEIESILTQSGLPAEEITSQIENKNIHYARFDIENGQLIYSKDNLIKEEDLTIQQKELYARIWAHIEKIIPHNYMNLLTRFEINTDGYDNVMAHVIEEAEDYSKWRLAIDLKDAVDAEGKFSDEFTNTVVHEFAHVMTLNKDQLQGETIVDEKAFSTQDIYLKTESYLNKFYQHFWKEIVEEHKEAVKKDAETGSEEAIHKFYEKYEDQFVSDYAATNPEEDIAETYRVFVIEDRPEGNTVRDQKIQFLYEFEEFVKNREEIRQALNLK